MEEILQKIYDILMKIFGSISGADGKQPEDPVKPPGTDVILNDWNGLIEAYKKYDSVEDHFKVASLAQWILESGRGTSKLSKEFLNFGGLKWREELVGLAVPGEIKVPSETKPVLFCKFKSVEDFIDGYWAFIGRSPYKGWEQTQTSFDYINHIKASGYATDPNYATKVFKVFEEAAGLLGLEEPDEEEPDRPNKSVTYEKPDIVTVKGVRFKTQGLYRTSSGKAKGLVVHYTVSGSSESSARGVLKYLASKGLGCLVMDRDGTIYKAENVTLGRDVAWHAGTSSWKGVSGISRHCMGMEICNWGKLDSTTRKRVFSKIRRVKSSQNIKGGDYESYTTAQEAALTNFILWQMDVNPEFNLDWVVGHDEIAPTRKSDPGGSLSMSMPKYRTYLKKLAKGLK